MKDDELVDMDAVVLFHAVSCAIKQSLQNGIDKKVLFSAYQKFPKILSKFGFNINKEKSLTENVNAILGILSKTGYVEGVEFRALDERTFELKIGKCALAEIGNMHSDKTVSSKVHCTYSIIVGSILHELSGGYVALSPSKLTRNGSITTMKIYKHAIQ